MFVMGILLNVILLQFVVVVFVLLPCCSCFDARYKSNLIDITDINNISTNRNNNIDGGSIVVDFNNNNNNNNSNINDSINITSINNIHNKTNNTINNNEIASRNNNNVDNTNIIIINNSDNSDKNIQHIHYQSDHGLSEISNESKLDDGRNIVARNDPVIYVETIFKTAYRPTNDKQMVNLSGLRNNKRIINESKPNAMETTIDSLTSRSSTYRLFKKHVQFFTPFPLVVLNVSQVESTTQQSENRNIVFTKFDDVGWEQRMIEWEAKLAGLTTERGNHNETRQLNLYRYHYNHFFWHPSKSTTFWLLVISGILLSFLIIGLAAILYLCHKDHGSTKLELTEQEDDDDDDESSQQNQWNNIERNSLVMELSATSKTKLLFESDEGSKLQDSPGNPKEASETSFDLRHSCQAQFQNSIFTKEEASECSRLGINSVDQISGKSLVECNYYWSND